MTIEWLIKEVMPQFNALKRSKGVNLSQATDEKIFQTVGKIWEHNKELERNGL
ncbi:MAG: hypothetical protein PHW31_04605 [Candidatus Pacebacteria bacterium]|nr:hypothetical protein [Candidatus Paceibacterota bacterium]